jgi:hypothetical protein
LQRWPRSPLLSFDIHQICRCQLSPSFLFSLFSSLFFSSTIFIFWRLILGYSPIAYPALQLISSL